MNIVNSITLAMQEQLLREILEKLTEIQNNPHYMDFNTDIIEYKMNELLEVSTKQLEICQRLLQVAEGGVEK
jgi:hypothetical protein